MKECEHKLTDSELKRNVHGPMFQYDFVPPKIATDSESNIDLGYSKETAVWRHEVNIRNKIK